jgi:hypothetical protein
VERRSVCDALKVIGIPKICIGPGNGGAVGYINSLRKGGAKIRIGRASIADEPAGVDVEGHQDGETPEIRRTRRLASLEGEKLVEVDRVCALGLQVSVEEVGMADFVDGVAGNVLRTVGIKVRERSLIAVYRLVRVHLYWDQFVCSRT